MISNKQVDLQDNSQVLLKITVSKAEIKKEYDNLISEYCNKVAVKGFRKGKVPAEILIKKFGPELKQETTQNIIQKSLEEAFETVEHKPLAYARPELVEEVELDLAKDLTFQIKYDTYPHITLGNYKGLKVEEPQVEITAEDLERELKNLQEKNSIVKEKANAQVEKGDVVSIDYSELNENKEEIENSKREGFVFEVGTGYNLYKIDDDILGMKPDEEKVITKTYDETVEFPELKGKTVTLKVTVKSIKTKVLPKIDDELAQDISEKYKTLDDLKKDIKEKLESVKEERIREQLSTQLIDQITAHTQVQIPASMLDMELEYNWRNFLNQNRTNEKNMIDALAGQGKTKADILKEWQPHAEKNLRSRLVLQEIKTKEKITVTEEEIDSEIKKYADNHGMEFEKAKQSYAQANMLEMLKESITRNKVFKFLIGEAESKKGKPVKFLDLLQS
ncbi:MAG: trigger factor [Spirochaetales bacterium]|nr:trigger factor [Spirochaetales bacterium]